MIRKKTRKMRTLHICGIASRIVWTSTRMPRIRWIERSGRKAFVNRRIETAGKPAVNCSTNPEMTTIASSQFLRERSGWMWAGGRASVRVRVRRAGAGARRALCAHRLCPSLCACRQHAPAEAQVGIGVYLLTCLLAYLLTYSLTYQPERK